MKIMTSSKNQFLREKTEFSLISVYSDNLEPTKSLDRVSAI